MNQNASVLLLVDTGAAGVGFTGPRSILDEAGIKLASGSEAEGIGGGGAIKVTPFNVAELSLGAARETDLTGIQGYRALGRDVPEGILWGWIGSHAEYDKLLK